MKYIKLFENHNGYSAYTADTENFILPNASYCIQEDEVHMTDMCQPSETYAITNVSAQNVEWSAATNTITWNWSKTSITSSCSEVITSGSETSSVTFDENAMPDDKVVSGTIQWRGMNVNYSFTQSGVNGLYATFTSDDTLFYVKRSFLQNSVDEYYLSDDGYWTSWVPDEYEGNPGYCAFSTASDFVIFKLKNGVTALNGAFGGESPQDFHSIVVPNGITSITKGDIEWAVDEIHLPSSIQTIGNEALWNDSYSTFTSVTFGANSQLRNIGENAFNSDMELLIADIPCCNIGDGAFRSCFSLSSMTISDNGRSGSIGNSAFTECCKMRSVYISSGITSIGDWAFGFEGWCSEAQLLTSITFAEGSTLQTIGENAFDGQENLSSITIPSSVTSIGDGAFSSCSGLTSIDIPNGVTSIGVSAFYGCRSLTSITIPSGITSISSSTFDGCTSLTSITIPSGITSIGVSAFSECVRLSSCTFAEGSQLTSIGNSAFKYCSGITSIEIPNSVTSIGNNGFYRCSGLTSVTCLSATPPTLGKWVFDGNASGRKIYVPSGSINAYKAATNWSAYAADIEAIPNQ